ncbi:hypothetical protein [Corynebacterium sp.]|uniref:hypothetical protein n=1 Tax=Corynebacterium sp. TaxID=1720 RepID=UPI0028ABEDD2|nr:hypothetical protein [Corynebacterium sp.]
MDIATFFTVVSGVASAAALVIAIWAKFDSQKSNKIAERSHEAAVESNGLARDANRVAVDARELAEEANTISRRAEARDTEPNLVSWDYSWINSATCQIINTGEHEALDVSATVAVDGEYVTHPTVNVEGSGTIEVFLPKLANKIHRHTLEFKAEQQQFFDRSTGPYGPIGMPPIELPLMLDVVVTIQWLTPLGKPRERIIQDPRSSF